MLRLVYSNHTEELLAELAARVRSQQVEHGVLVPVRVVVQSGTVESYLQLGLARVCGIAANLDAALLTRFASDVVASVSGARIADASAFEAMALALLLDDAALGAPDLAPVLAYLHAAGDAPDAVDLRRVQLAARVGRLFEEYTYSRGDMLLAWARGPTLGASCADTEAWQRRMWLAMFGEQGLAARRAASGQLPLLPLHEAVAGLEPQPGQLPPAVHVFGFSHVARTFHDLFARIARATDVVVYALSPCEGFWEDVDARDPAPLHLWGRPGREQVRALNAMASFDHEDRFVDPRGDRRASGTVLRRLQSDILRRETPRAPAAPEPASGGDGSIAILEHASVRRELEAVASEIWRLVEADETLRFDDIAVVVPDADAGLYGAQLPAVFREAHELPCHMAQVPVPGGSPVVEAVDMLLALPLGRFTRHELLRLAVHPAVVASFDDVDPQRWVAWCDALGVVHGADRADHEGTYIRGDILNWDQGLRRLALGSFMVGDASGERRPFELAGESYVPYEVAASELRDAAAFGTLVRSLLADARFAREMVATMAEWSAFLRAMVEAYVAPTRPSEEEQLAGCLRRLHALGELDLGGRKVRYRVACELARARVASLNRAQGGEGVLVSTLSSLRPLPMRVVFACGMGEGRFPTPDSDDPLDLRWAERREGDVTARERDKYAFLELLLGARDRLYASYVSRDPVSGDSLAPSSVVQELLHALAPAYVRDADLLRRRHPLRRWDPRYFPDLFGGAEDEAGLGTTRVAEARAEARTLALRRSLEASGGRFDPDDALARAGTDPAWAALVDHLGIARLPEAAPAPEGRVELTISALTKFLEFPLQGWARFRVGLEEAEDEDVMAREDEPFETDRREETVMLRGVLLDAAAGGKPVEQAYDEVARDRALRGRGPSGLFAQGERSGHLEALEVWRSELAKLDVDAGAIEVHRFGRAGEHARADHVHDALALDVDVTDAAGVTRVVRAQISGRTSPMGAGGGATLALFKRTDEKKKDPWARADRARASLRAFVHHAILAASGVAEGRAHTSVIVVATPGEPVTERVRFAPLSRDEAVVWLRGVARDLLSGPHAYFLPCEAVFVHAEEKPEGPLAPWLAAARDRLADSDGPLALRSAYGPVPRPNDPARYPTPDEDAARAMVARRLGAFFATRGEAS